MTESPPVATITDNQDELVGTALALLSFETPNPPGDTREVADWVQQSLGEAGLTVDRIVADPAKPNLLTTIPGDSDWTLLFLGHLDTVPFEANEWSRDPLGERDADRIYGRGATDMKGPLAAMIESVRAFAGTETTPPVTLSFLLVSDEEIAGDAGLPTVLDAGVLDANACLIGETTSQEERYSLTVADRGSIWLTLEATGEGAHGSRPMLGENAIDRLYGAVEQIRATFGQSTLDTPAQVDALIDESVEYYRPMLNEDAARRLFEQPTINLGTLEGGESVNSVPTTARARLDIRLAPGVQTSDVLADIRGCANECNGVDIVDVSWSVGTFESLDDPLVGATTALAESITDDTVYRRSATGGGDAKKLRNAGIPTIEFAFGTDTVHAVDEYTTVDALTRNAELYTRLPSELANRIG